MYYTTHVTGDFQTGLPEIFLRSVGPKNYQIIPLCTSNELSEAGERFCTVFGVEKNLESLIKYLKQNQTLFYAPVPA